MADPLGALPDLDDLPDVTLDDLPDLDDSPVVDPGEYLRSAATVKTDMTGVPKQPGSLRQWAIRRGREKVEAVAQQQKRPLPSPTSEEALGQGAYEMAMELARRREEARQGMSAGGSGPAVPSEAYTGIPDVDDTALVDMTRESMGLKPIGKPQQGVGMSILKGAISAGKAPVDLLGGLMGPSSPAAAASQAGQQGLNKWTQNFAAPTMGEQVAETAGSLIPSLVTAGGSTELAALGALSPGAVNVIGGNPTLARLLLQGAAPTASKWTSPLGASMSSLGSEMAQTGNQLPEMFSEEGLKLGLRGAAEGVATRAGGKFEPFLDRFDRRGVRSLMPILGEAGEGGLAGGLQSSLTTGNTFSEVLSDIGTGALSEAAGAGMARAGQGMSDQARLVARSYENQLRAKQGLPPLEAPVIPGENPPPQPMPSPEPSVGARFADELAGTLDATEQARALGIVTPVDRSIFPSGEQGTPLPTMPPTQADPLFGVLRTRAGEGEGVGGKLKGIQEPESVLQARRDAEIAAQAPQQAAEGQEQDVLATQEHPSQAAGERFQTEIQQGAAREGAASAEAQARRAQAMADALAAEEPQADEARARAEADAADMARQKQEVEADRLARQTQAATADAGMTLTKTPKAPAKPPATARTQPAEMGVPEPAPAEITPEEQAAQERASRFAYNLGLTYDSAKPSRPPKSAKVEQTDPEAQATPEEAASAEAMFTTPAEVAPAESVAKPDETPATPEEAAAAEAMFGAPAPEAPQAAPAPAAPPAIVRESGAVSTPTVHEPSKGPTRAVGTGNRRSIQVEDNPAEQVNVETVKGEVSRAYGVGQLPSGEWVQWGHAKGGESRRGASDRVLDAEGRPLTDWSQADARMAKFPSKEAALADLRAKFENAPSLEAETNAQVEQANTTRNNLQGIFKRGRLEWSDDPAVRADRALGLPPRALEVATELEGTLAKLTAGVQDKGQIQARAETPPAVEPIQPSAPATKSAALLKGLGIDPTTNDAQVREALEQKIAQGEIEYADLDEIMVERAKDAGSVVRAATNVARRGSVSFGGPGDPNSLLNRVSKATFDRGEALIEAFKPTNLREAARQLNAEDAAKGEIRVRMSDDDLLSGTLSSVVLPSYIANKHPEFAPIKDAASERMRSIHEDVAIVARGTPELQRLAGPAREAVNKVLDEQRLAGRDFTDAELHSKLDVDGVTAVKQQRAIVEVIRENIKQQAFHKAGFDPQSTEDFGSTVDAMEASGDSKAASARALHDELSSIDNMTKGGYTPFRRPSGKYVIFAKDADGNTVYSTRADSFKEAARLAQEARAKYGSVERPQPITVSEAEAIDQAYMFGNSPAQLERIAQRAGMTPAALSELMDKVAPKLAAGGARSSLLRSDDVPGYDPDHVGSLHRTYLASVMGKRNAQFQRVVDTQRSAMTDAGKAKLRDYTDAYADMQLAPSGKFSDAVRTGTFFMTSAVKPSTLLTNLTQPMVFHAPEMIDLGASPAVYVRTAVAMMNQLGAIPRAGLHAIFEAKNGKTWKEAWKNASPTEAMILSYERNTPEFGKVLRSLADRGELGDNMIEAFAESGKDRNVVDTMARKMSAPFAETERMNRMASAKVAFDLYDAKKGSQAWWDHAKKRGYRGPTEGPEAGQKFVEWAISRSNFEYGKANRPLLGGGRVAGTPTNAELVGASLYSMKHFQVSSLGTVLRMMSNLPKDHEARKAFVAMFAGLIAAGGLTGLPFAGQVYDLLSGVGNATGATNLGGINEEMAGVRQYVADHYTKAGADILAGGVGRAVGSPTLEAVGKRTGLQNVVPNVSSWEQAVGVPASAVGRLVRDTSTMVSEIKDSGSDKAKNLGRGQSILNVIEDLGLPVSGLGRAFNQAKTGDVTDRRGEVVHGATISPVATAAGFIDPMSDTMREAKEAKKNVEEDKLDMKAGIVRDFTESIRTGDPGAIKGAVARLIENNKQAIASKQYENLMSEKELRASIVSNFSNLEFGPLSPKAIKAAKPQDRIRLMQLRTWVEGEIESRKPENEETPVE